MFKMKISLSRSDLILASACDEGIALFDRISGGADDISIGEGWEKGDWQLADVWLRAGAAKHYGWIRNSGWPQADLSGANLSRAIGYSP